MPTLARPTYSRDMVSHSESQQTVELLRDRTIPLFKLFPGRPRRIFFSSTGFFGGILVLLAKVLVWIEWIGRGRITAVSVKAEPADL